MRYKLAGVAFQPASCAGNCFACRPWCHGNRADGHQSEHGRKLRRGHEYQGRSYQQQHRNNKISTGCACGGRIIAETITENDALCQAQHDGATQKDGPFQQAAGCSAVATQRQQRPALRQCRSSRAAAQSEGNSGSAASSKHLRRAVRFPVFGTAKMLTTRGTQPLSGADRA